jgi:hypothetical protein
LPSAFFATSQIFPPGSSDSFPARQRGRIANSAGRRGLDKPAIQNTAIEFAVGFQSFLTR